MREECDEEGVSMGEGIMEAELPGKLLGSNFIPGVTAPTSVVLH